ncbi:MAG: divalent metal cation (Fe/Co/Zn/Cd) transporter [Flavobacteriaceae bacterium]|jgi:divalent metal cation (Fe/Co/Zn/Cd) transporter
MIAEAFIPGAFRMIAIIIGVFIIVRYIGQLMNAKRNVNEQAADAEQRENIKRAQEHSRQNLGKTNVIGKNKGSNDVEDVDFEEVDFEEVD